MHGGGRAVYFAGEIEPVVVGRCGPRFVVTERLVGELVRWLGGERVRVQGPRNMAVQMHRIAGGAAVHLVARPAADGHPHEGVAPSGEIEIAIPQTLYTSSVRALDGTDVHWELTGRRLRIVVDGVSEYRCLVIEGALG
jgi:hypothetical protein